MSEARRAAAVLALVLGAAARPAFAAPAAAPFKPAPAPALQARSLEGERIDLAKLLEKGPVLIDFWATWCRPCQASLPEIESLHRRLGPRGLGVIGVSIDGPRNYAKVRPFVARMGLHYPIVVDEDGRIQESFGVRAVPTAILVDRSGMVARVQQGYRPGEEKLLEEAIVGLLGPAARDSASADSAATDSSATDPK